VRRNGPRGGRSLFGRLRPRQVPGRRSTPQEPVVVAPRRSFTVDRIVSADRAGEAAGQEPDGHEDLAPAPSRQAPAPVAVAPSREPRHVRAVPTNADLKMARALDVFNVSAHPRRIAGVARSLGRPAVTVLPSATEGSIVSIVVGWELCWYRYAVDLADEAAGVQVTGQGAELTDLSPEELAVNAVADERGKLALGA
jgi:hypothetical protein